MPKLQGTLALSHLTGEKIFNNIGCAACHTRQVGKIDGIYSDLLLHDMGADLSDPAPAIPSGGSSFRSSGYGGGSFLPSTPITSSLAELRRKWRTPPLWGVRNSIPTCTMAAHHARRGRCGHGRQGRSWSQESSAS